MTKEKATILIERPDESQYTFSGDSIEEAQEKLANWLTDGQKDMVAFTMTDAEGIWSVALVHIEKGPNAGKWNIVDAPPGEPNEFGTFETARDQFVALAGQYADSVDEVSDEQNHLLASVIFTKERDSQDSS